MLIRAVSRSRVDQRGFTLAELLVAVAMIGLVMAGLLTLLTTGSVSYLTGTNQVATQSALRLTLERMTREIREAGYNTTGLPLCTPPPVPAPCMDSIINATATSFTIQNDWNGNGLIQPAIVVPVAFAFGNVQRGEQTTYSIAGSTLQRQESGVDAAAQTLVTNVAQASLGGAAQPFFQYLDADGNVLPTPIANPSLNQSNIRAVVVNFQAGVQGLTPQSWQAGAIQVTMSDRIRLRNR